MNCAPQMITNKDLLFNENLFLSQDKMSGGTFNNATNLKIKIGNNKDHTPINIFNTYLKTSTVASPIPLDQQTHNDFCDVDSVQEFFDFN